MSMMVILYCIFGLRNGGMILIPTTQKHQETRYGVIQQQFAHLKMKKGRNTYFLSLSCKGDDHSAVEDIFRKSWRFFRQRVGFYHSGLKHLIWVKLCKLLVCVDISLTLYSCVQCLCRMTLPHQLPL